MTLKKTAIRAAMAVVALAFAASSRAGELPPAAEQMAKTYGLDPFGAIEDIRYTFHGITGTRGSSKKPSLIIATWEGYKKAGPLLISTEHRGTADGGPFHEFFSDVAVKVTGSDTWINAQ
jgi:hypothetical protein